MQLRTRCALGATALSMVALAGAVPAAQAAQPAVCGTRMFMAVDHAVAANPAASARLLGFAYRVAPQQSLASFDVLAECDAMTARSVFNDLRTQDPSEANSFEQAFRNRYPQDASAVFGGGGGGVGVS